ncbi:hypothetical protein HK105_208171 [Polyrhizophydium stewartii]|uniref:Uncharacterized protein n=1 Tax=Polyrhizophydium stewartii TaxID=2732419 RepID=A0ABR4MYK5_9FUNG
MPNPFDTHKQVIGGTLAPQPGDARALGRFGPELYPHDPAACGLPETLGALAGPLRLVVGRGTTALARIPSAAFTQVVVDWSTWRYMRPLAPGIAAHWRRITAQPGGAWAVEGGVSSYRIVADTAAVPVVPVPGDHGSEICCEFDNPSHVVVREGTVRRWMAQCPDWDGRPPVSAAEAQLDGGVVNGSKNGDTAWSKAL